MKRLLIAVICVMCFASDGQAQWLRRRTTTTPQRTNVPQRTTAPREVTQPVEQTQDAPEDDPKEAIEGGIPESAKWEILRMGNRVKEIGTGHGGVSQLFALAVAAPPPDDSYKWYITVITTKGCAACESLLNDFAHNDELRAFANREDFTQSWSHFNVFSAEDQTQKFRWAKIKVTKYPVLIVQPPLNKKFGNPKTVVMQNEGYDGDAAALAEKIRRSIRYYVERMQVQGIQPGGMEAAAEEPTAGADPKFPPAAEIGIDPPFEIPQLPVVPRTPGPDSRILPVGPPKTPDDSSLLPSFPSLSSFKGWATVVAVFVVVKWIVYGIFGFIFGGGLGNLMLLVIIIILLILLARLKRGTDVYLDPAVVAALAPKQAPASSPAPSLAPVPQRAAMPATRTAPVPVAPKKKPPVKRVMRARVHSK